MKILKNKTKISTIAFVLMLTFAVSFISFLPTIYADEPIDVDVYLFLSVAPNPVGVGQEVWIVMMCSRVPAMDAQRHAIFWQNWVVTATKPDGTKVNVGTYKSDIVGATFTRYIPDQIGTWYFEFSFPGQTGEGSMTGYYFLPATSNKFELVVQEEPISYWQANPLPTDYWSRPINPENRDWWQISGNWLVKGYDNSGFTGFNPYTEAPNTAHILWTKEIAFGGIVGGDIELAYDPKWLNPIGNPIIINGRIYFSERGGLACVDVRTGEELWWQEGLNPDWGQVYYFGSAQQHGAYAYLWSCRSTWKMYDALTGDWILDMANATSVGGMFSPASLVMSPKGEMLVYFMGGRSPNRWLAMWNSSAVTGMMSAAYGLAEAQVWSWSPRRGATLDWKTGVQWNVTLGVEGTPGITKIDPKKPDVIYSRRTFTQPDLSVLAMDMAFSLTPGEEGRVLWGPTNRTIEPSRSTIWMNDGVFTDYTKEKLQLHGYDVYTGRELWTATPYEGPYGVYHQVSSCGGYDKVYHGTYEGVVHCVDLQTGDRLWDYFTGSAGLESPYGHWPFYGGQTVADGKVYAPTGEHTPVQPFWKGHALHCINASTGDGVWSIRGLFMAPAIADGHALTTNAEDNRLYCFSKGPSATTVSIQNDMITHGDSVLVKGMVTDESPGMKSSDLTARFPNGVPAIADEYMTPWMEYLYMQQQCPEDAEGVEVVLETLDPNGNYYEIGRTTSDTNGAFGCVVDPPVPGKYKIIATFEGSESYFSSTASTYLWVEEAPSPAQRIEPEAPEEPAEEPVAPEEPAEEPTEPEAATEPEEPEEPTEPEPTEPTEAPLFTTTDLAIIAAVAVAVVIGVAAYWQLRKRK
jgi:outer membrane protein assembly factor BamB